MQKTSHKKPTKTVRRRKTPVADELTRQRLLEAGGEIFAEVGFYAAKVRDICGRAGANVAAVNYHFGDKLGLYKEVLRYSLYASINEESLRSISSALPLEEKLRIFVRTVLQGMFSRERQAWHAKLMMHEMVQPTPALNDFIDQLIRPKFIVLLQLVGSILGQDPDSHATHLCAHSVIGQVRHYVIGRDVIGKLSPDIRFGAKDLDEFAGHIAAFSFAGLTALRREGSAGAGKVKQSEMIGASL